MNFTIICYVYSNIVIAIFFSRTKKTFWRLQNHPKILQADEKVRHNAARPKHLHVQPRMRLPTRNRRRSMHGRLPIRSMLQPPRTGTWRTPPQRQRSSTTTNQRPHARNKNHQRTKPKHNVKRIFRSCDNFRGQ